ncbi:hypothetical protein BDV18DRAFT_132288 [Aspergillus unguis]
MGCCFSVSRDPHPTTEEHHHDPNTTASQSHPSSAPSSSRHRPQRTPHHASSLTQTDVPLPQHINAPIRPHVWHSKKRLWTRALLDRERREFFETRVTGRPEVWAALAAALSLMQSEDYATAQSIIDAAGVTVPTGDLCQGVYDEQGVLYRLPRCIVSDPDNIVEGVGDGDGSERTGTDDDGEASGSDEEVDVGFETEADSHAHEGEHDTDAKTGFGIGIGEGVESGDELIGTTATGARMKSEERFIERERERRRDEKGKTSERDLIRVKARLSDRDGEDVIIAMKKTQHVSFLARKLQQEVGLPRTQRIRVAYLGRILKESAPLVDQGWVPGNVVNALVVARRSSM